MSEQSVISSEKPISQYKVHLLRSYQVIGLARPLQTVENLNNFISAIVSAMQSPLAGLFYHYYNHYDTQSGDVEV